MLADAERVDAELVGQHRLLDHLADDLGVAVEAAVGAGGDVAKCIETEFHGCAATSMQNASAQRLRKANEAPLMRRLARDFVDPTRHQRQR